MYKNFSNLILYVFVGGSAALVNWAVFYVCLEKFAIAYMLAGFMAFVLATLWNFILAKRFIFKDSKHSLLKESALIYIVSFLGLCLDMGVLYMCVEWLKLDEMLSKIIATGIAFFFNFSIRNFIIYKEV